MRLPEFVIIGAPKCGTTTLYSYLLRHPQVFLPTPKEPQFFSDSEVYARGEDWYRSLFAAAREDQVCGEASTTYTRWPHTGDAAQRIARTLPDARLVYIMRHPVDRAYSHYAHHMRFRVSEGFEEALAKSDIYLDCSLYMKQIRRYLRYFPRSALEFFLLDDLKRNPHGVIHRLQEFLGVEPRDLVRKTAIVANVSGPDFYIRNKTTNKIRRIPGGSAVADAIPQALRTQIFSLIKSSPLGRRIARQYRLKPMLPATRERLLEFFEGPNSELARFLGRDLGAWSR